jgi:hypothetical protein
MDVESSRVSIAVRVRRIFLTALVSSTPPTHEEPKGEGGLQHRYVWGATACEARRGELQSKHAGELEFHRFAQFLAHEQHRLLRQEVGRLGLRLSGDLQVGLSPQDAWSYALLFDAIVAAAHGNGRLTSDLVCKVLSTAGSAFLRAYLPPVRRAGLVPAEPDELAALLRVLLLDKAVYELGYELNNRPAWARIPIRGILDQLGNGF